MANQPEHIVKSYSDDLRRLRELVARMGGLAERQVADAAYVLTRRDATAAAEVAARDAPIDGLERDKLSVQGASAVPYGQVTGDKE